MESSSLESVLTGEVTAPQVTEPTQTQEVVQEQVTEQVQEATGEQTGTPPEAKQDDPLEKHRKGLEAAAAAERKRRQEAESRAEAAERRARELEQQFQRPKVETQGEKPKPVRADFQSEDEWMEAVLDWRDEQRAAAWQAQQAQQAQLAKVERTQSIFVEAQKLPGFDIQAFARLPVTEKMADAILESEASAHLVHFLTANPAEAYRIAALPETRQIKELTRIEDKLTATPARDDPEAKDKPRLPETLTQTRNAKGQFDKAYDGPTPLNSILK